MPTPDLSKLTPSQRKELLDFVKVPSPGRKRTLSSSPKKNVISFAPMYDDDPPINLPGWVPPRPGQLEFCAICSSKLWERDGLTKCRSCQAKEASIHHERKLTEQGRIDEIVKLMFEGRWKG